MNKTNLEYVKSASIAMLYFDITDIGYCIASHPFTNTTISIDKEGNMLNLTFQNDAQLWRSNMEEIINNAKDLIKIYMMVNKVYKLAWLKACKKFMSISDFSKLLGYAWVESENPNIDVNVTIEELIEWFEYSDKEYLMSKDDFEAYNKLTSSNEPITLYRGIGSRSEKFGLSWTSNLDKAKWFANRFGTGYIITTKVSPSDILSYFGGRGEDEYVIDVSKYKENYNIIKNI